MNIFWDCYFFSAGRRPAGLADLARPTAVLHPSGRCTPPPRLAAVGRYAVCLLSDDEDCDRTRATPLCPYGADRTWEIGAARAAPLTAETMSRASAAARAPAAAS
eukprot:COSAG01_NODE_9819_length_2333_cov_1.580573_2_plen_104_part_01